jgi:transposase-like protein
MSKTANIQPVPDPAPESTPRRRSFTAEYKARILAECDAVTEPGQIGAILRREGLYSSHLVDWRSRRKQAGLDGLAPKKVGRPPKNPVVRANEKELERLRRENARLQEKLRRSEIIVEAQKKLAEVLASLPRSTNGSDE